MNTKHIRLMILPGMMLLMMLLLSSCQMGVQSPPDDKPTLLRAAQAKVTGALRIQGTGEAATIHFWNKVDDTITWTWAGAKPGNYRVALNYALPRNMTGGKISFVAGEQQIIAPAEPTASWADFRTFDLGVVRVDRLGDIAVTLRAAQLPQVSAAAMPDVAWLSLTPTDAPATAKPCAASATTGQ